MQHCKLSSAVFTTLAIIVLLIALGCDSPNGPGTGLPRVTALNPTNNARGQDMNLFLEWAYSDTVTADLSFSVYFGTAAFPPLVESGLTEMKFTPGVLNKNRTYYWRVQVSDSSKIISSSPVYKFKTGIRFTYPLKVGYGWKYLQTYQSINFNPPELADQYGHDDRFYVNSVIKGMITLRDSTPTYALHSWATDTSIAWHTRESISFINNTDSGLCLYAYEGPSSITPKKPVDYKYVFYRFRGRNFDRIENLISFGKDLMESPSLAAFNPTIIYEDPPVYSLRYPLQEDMRWTYRTGDNPWPIDKRVMGWVDLQTPAGSFECLQIEWLWDIDGHGEWDDDMEGFDYVGPKGLVMRAYLFKGVEVHAYDTPNNPLGTMDIIDEYVLIEYTLD
ncbi:MAG: hypothetical protein GY841_21160 [FCB group bacterium]|nr:hypothetical protein [FCB group bacterium]